jgi:hypothetical protein
LIYNYFAPAQKAGKNTNISLNKENIIAVIYTQI